jgi:c-di-GMP-binding flagellar brake protein YcgR
MVWFSRRAVLGLEPGNQRRFYRQSIELPVAIGVEGLPAAVYGTLVNISETGCRIRSLILVERERPVTFGLKRSSGPGLSLRGRVVMREDPERGGGYEYGISFEPMDEAKREALAQEIREMQRREAAARASLREQPAITRGSTAQRRGSVRTLAIFPVRYRLASRAAMLAEANDVSTGGLRLLAREALAVGATAELRFTLPDNFLDVYPPASERAEISPFGRRKVRLPDNRRPFHEILVHGRIITRLASMRGREIYGVAFIDIDGYQREEIARFTHAVQLARLRSN